VALYPALPLPEHSLGTPDDALRLDEPGRMHIFKTHDIENEETVVALSARADVIIVTIRDPRDAVSSLMSYHPHGYDLCKPSEAARAFEQSPPSRLPPAITGLCHATVRGYLTR